MKKTDTNSDNDIKNPQDIHVSVIIPHLRPQFQLDACLNALLQNTHMAAVVEIIIVGEKKAKVDECTLVALKNQNYRIRVLSSSSLSGYSQTCNLAAEAAHGKYLVFLREDVEVGEGWLEAGLACLGNYHKAGIVGAEIWGSDRKTPQCGLEFQPITPDQQRIYTIWPTELYAINEGHAGAADGYREVEAISSAVMILEKHFFQQIGQFDKKYKRHFAEIDLCFRVRRAGKRVITSSECKVFISDNHREYDVTRRGASEKEAMRYFYRKWHRVIGRLAIRKLTEQVAPKQRVFREDILPVSLKSLQDHLVDFISHWAGILEALGPIYAHFGGAGDACLLLSTFYDENPCQTILSVPNSVKMAQSFFASFPALKEIIFLPNPKLTDLHAVFRQIMHQLANVKGLGATPFLLYPDEWKKSLNIFNKYGIRRTANWAKHFARRKLFPFQVTVAPMGSLMGMVPGKKNILNPVYWKRLIAYLNSQDITPVIIGTPEERSQYPNIGRTVDRRSYSFQDQMELIASSDFFIGADSWGKSFAALAEIPTIVFEAMHDRNWEIAKDVSDYVFLDPWDIIRVVRDIGEFKTVFMRLKKNKGVAQKTRTFNVCWEGAQFMTHSLAMVNRECCLNLIRQGVNLSVIPTQKDQYTPDMQSPYAEILGRYHKKLPVVDVVVRHQWPPDLRPPERGHWVVIQPWEFGYLPRKWATVFATQVDEMWVPSHYVRKVYINSGIPEDNVKVIPNGVDPLKFHPEIKPYRCKTRKRFKFLFVGGTIFRKGIDILLQAYGEAFSADDDVCLVIKDMGGESFYKGQTANEFIQKMQSDPNSPEIEYIDAVLPEEKLVGLYTACDVLVHPYRGEGFGLPILEAMACDRPVIVTKGGACLDFCNDENSLQVKAPKKQFPDLKIVDEELTGVPWLYEPDKTELIRQMKFAFDHPQEMKAMGCRAGEHVRRNFTWKHTATRIGESLPTLIAKPLKRSQNGIEFQIAAAKELLEKGRHSRAKIIYEGLSQMKRDCRVQFGLAVCLAREQKYREAMELLNDLIHKNPDHYEAYHEVGSISFAIGDFQNAKILFEIAMQKNPAYIPSQRSYAETMLELGEYENCVQTLHNILARRPDDVQTLLRMAKLYEEVGKRDMAVGYLSTAIGYEPHNEQLIRLAAAYSDYYMDTPNQGTFAGVTDASG